MADGVEVVGVDGQVERTYNKASGAVAEAIAFQTLSSEAFDPQRKRENDDLAFQVPENQWPEDAKQLRQGEQIGATKTPARPMLSIPILDQPIQLQYNHIEKADLGVVVHPRNDKAKQETAELLQDMYRAIQADPASPAQQARLWAADRALKCGWGCYRILTQYDEAADDPRDQKIVIERILHQSSVFFDPFAQKPDFSDANHCLIVSYMSWAAYKQKYPKSKMASYGEEQFGQLLDDYPFWIDGSGESRAVCVAEYFCKKYEEMTWVLLEDGTFVHADRVPQGARVVQEDVRTFQRPYVQWYKVNAVEELEPSVRWMGSIIPVIPVIGIELQPFGGERQWSGMITKNKDAARLVNYEVSNAVERDALSPKAPYIGAVGQFKTMRKQWDQANIRNFSTLEYDPVTAGGTLAPPPERNIASVDLSSALQLVELAKNLVQIGTASTDATTLEQLARKKVAKETIAGLAGQSEFGNSHFLQNLATISMPLEARIVLELLPLVYDRPERVMKVIGVDGDARLVMLNAPYVVDPQTKRPVAAPNPTKEQNVKHYDLKSGSYDYVIDVGKSHKTRMQAGSDALTQLIAADPKLLTLLGDIWANFQDFPGHTEIAKRFKAMLPPQIQALEDGEEKSPEQLQAELSQATQMLQQLQAILVEQQKQIEMDAVKQQGETQRQAMKSQAAEDLAILQGRIDTFLQELEGRQKVQQIYAKEHAELVKQDDAQQHEMALSAADSQHESEQLEKQARMAEASARAGDLRGAARDNLTDNRANQQESLMADREDVRAERTADREDARSEREAAREPKGE